MESPTPVRVNVAQARYALIGLIIVAIIIAGLGYYTYTSHKSEKQLVIYVYSDFMAWGENPEAVWKQVFDAFGEKYGVNVTVRTFDDARTALVTAIDEYKRGVRTADLIIGVDNILVYEAKSAGIIECYFSPVAQETVPQDIVNVLDPDKCVTPIDYGLITLVYDPAKLDNTTLQVLEDKPSFADLANPQIASKLIVEDPTKSSPGLSFLYWEIAVTSKLEGKDWKEWWNNVKNNILVTPSWGDAYDEFLREGGTRGIVVSYGTDPAYSAWYNNGEPSISAALIYYNGKSTAWLQVEGALVVKGQPGTEWAKKFVDWLLSTDIQELIPSNQWMLPANSKAKLPDYYKYALTIDDVDIIANNLLTPEEIQANYETWLLDWTQIMGS